MARRPAQGAAMSTGVRTLVLGMDSLAGAIFALPTLDALVASGRELSMATSPSLHPLLRLLPGVRQVLALEETGGTAAGGLRRAGCLEAVILTPILAHAWRAFRAGIPYRWGYSRGLGALLLRPAVPAPDLRHRHPAQDFAELLAAMGVVPPQDWEPHLNLPPEVLARGGERLERARIPANVPALGLLLSADLVSGRRWPWKRLAELSRRLRREHPDSRQVLISGVGELWQAVRLHETTGRIHPVVGPDLDLSGLAAVLAHLHLAVGEPSGMLLLAAAVGVPCVVLVGAADPRRIAPQGPQHCLIQMPGEGKGLAWLQRLRRHRDSGDDPELAQAVAACREILAV